MTTHELRSPVRVTESLMMTLADGYVGPLSREQADVVARAQRRLATLHALVDDLLALAAGKADLVSIRITTFDLRAIVTEVTDRFRTVAGEKQVGLAVELPDTQPSTCLSTRLTPSGSW